MSEPTSQPTSPPESERPRFRLSHRSRQPDATAAQRSSNRETVESVVIAFILAFLFRTFEAEAFVIPTGSMAPTLMGRHKEVPCSECRWVFTVGATEEQDRASPLTHGICPNCRYVNDIEKSPAFKGDRILVLKALYDLPDLAPAWMREPRRWDVVVFKFPEEPQVNYIKRLVGLPNEELRIRYGDVYTRTDEQAEFRIARKSARKQQVMRMLVYHNNYQSAQWHEQGWPSRWQSDPPEAWNESDDRASFDLASGRGESDDWSRLSYHHLARSWGLNGRTAAPPRARLVTDFYAYNAGMAGSYPRDGEQQPHWVGDLALRASVDIDEPVGQIRLELVEAGERFICEFDVASASCRLLRGDAQGGAEQLLATAGQAIGRPGKYAIEFGNTDDRLTVWLDDKLLFGEGFDYEGPGLDSGRRPTRADLEPAAVAVRGVPARVSDLVLYRDIYYTHGAGNGSGNEYDTYLGSDDSLSDPAQWQTIANARVSAFGKLGPDAFMMMGDNSPRSKDGRLWVAGARQWIEDLARERDIVLDELDAEMERIEREVAQKAGGQVVLAPPHVVDRQLLIGRAFYVYWPHAVPFGPEWAQFDVPLGRLGTFRVPFYPNVARMKMIE